MNDVIIIGGSFAGLAAALQLGRARRKATALKSPASIGASSGSARSRTFRSSCIRIGPTG
ncbi:hypothetical protein SAMN03159297_01987 [Pseudomonas sp. NFACC45]|nr:hypothetical protein SAMN03159297_01987 [Pseudomonas sp. NFACC45]